MSITEPNPPSEPGRSNGHAGGDIASEELAGRLTSAAATKHGHFTTHFDEPSIDYSSTGTAIDATTIAELQVIAGRYPQSRSALLPMLHLVQSVEGRVTPRGIEVCAEILGLSTAEVSGVATFYTMYKRRPVGEYHVGVCTTALCAIMGGDEVYAKLQDHLGIGNDETTDDGEITLEHLECNAACDFAPVMMVNWEFFDNTTAEKGLRGGRRAPGRRDGDRDPRCPGVHLAGGRAGAGRVLRRSGRRGTDCCEGIPVGLADRSREGLDGATAPGACFVISAL